MIISKDVLNDGNVCSADFMKGIVFVGCLRDASESSLATTQQSLITPDNTFRVQY